MENLMTSLLRVFSRNSTYCEDIFQNWWDVHDWLLSEGVDIRSKITPYDLVWFKISRNFLLSAVFLPTFLYYLGFGEKSPKFPASVSHIIRHGVPRWANVIMFLLAALSLQIPVNRIGDVRIYFWLYYLLSTGFVWNVLCPNGRGFVTDIIHVIAVFLCLLGWGAMLYITNMGSIYVWLFKVFVILMCIFFWLRLVLEFELPGSTKSFSERSVSKLNVKKSLKARIWGIELAFMLCEFGCITSLMIGCTSGLVDEPGTLWGLRYFG